MIRLLFTTVGFFLGAALSCNADEIVGKLCGVEGREWTKIRWEQVLGAEGRCKQGETWTFRSQSMVTIKTCEANTPVVSEKAWVLLGMVGGEHQIQIGEKVYKLRTFTQKERSKDPSLPETAVEIVVLTEIRKSSTTAKDEITLTYRDF